LALVFATLPFFERGVAGVSSLELIEKGHFKRAQAMLEKQASKGPQWNYEMSRVAVAYKRFDEAIQEAGQAVAANPHDAEYQAQLADAIGSKLSEGDVGFFAQISLAKRFRKEVELALKLDPKNVGANFDLMEFCLDAPGMAGGDKKKAHDMAEQMVRWSPVNGYLMKAQIAIREKQNSEAERFFNQAIAADMTSYDARTGIAELYASGDAAKAGLGEGHARQAIKLDAERIGGHAILARIFSKQGRWQDLDATLVAAERCVPDDLAPYYQAAEVILLSRDGEELARAERYLRRYLDQPPEGGEPTLAAGHWRLGLILERQGRKDQARHELETAVKMDSALKEAKHDLKSLR
jgi:tetratricopeptide (TPR) repeat protein